MCSGLAPSEITFPEEDTDEVNVSNLPTIYRAIWETARKHDIADDITKRIVAMYAYDVDLTKKISPGDSIEMLETERDADGKQDLLYVGLKLGATVRQLYRFPRQTTARSISTTPTARPANASSPGGRCRAAASSPAASAGASTRSSTRASCTPASISPRRVERRSTRRATASSSSRLGRRAMAISSRSATSTATRPAMAT